MLVRPSTPSVKAISPKETNHRSPLHSVPTAPVHTLLAMTTAWHGMPSAKAVLKMVTGMKSATGLILGPQPTKSDGAEKTAHHRCHGKGKTADMVQVITEEAPPWDELFVNVVDFGTVGDTHPEEIVVDDVFVPWCNDVFTIVQLPASTSSKGTASLCIKVNLELEVMCCPSMCSNVSTQPD